MQEVCFTILVTIVVSGFSLPVAFDPKYPWVYSGKFEGDIILELDHDAKTGANYKWPNGVMHYQFEESLNQNERNIVLKSFEEFHNKTCLKILPRTNQENYVEIGKWEPDSCHSKIGMRGQRQKLNLGVKNYCFYHGAIVHELMHAFGFWHQHSVPNRDEYITILWQNIIKGERDQFLLSPSSAATDFGVGYDYGSIMHYPRNAFSIDKGRLYTIQPKDPRAIIGQRIGLSKKDVMKLNRMYNC